MRLRNISRIIVIALVIVVAVIAILHQRIAVGTPPKHAGGGALNHPALVVALHDTSGRERIVSLGGFDPRALSPDLAARLQ